MSHSACAESRCGTAMSPPACLQPHFCAVALPAALPVARPCAPPPGSPFVCHPAPLRGELPCRRSPFGTGPASWRRPRPRPFRRGRSLAHGDVLCRLCPAPLRHGDVLSACRPLAFVPSLLLRHRPRSLRRPQASPSSARPLAGAWRCPIRLRPAFAAARRCPIPPACSLASTLLYGDVPSRLHAAYSCAAALSLPGRRAAPAHASAAHRVCSG